MLSVCQKIALSENELVHGTWGGTQGFVITWYPVPEAGSTEFLSRFTPLR